MFTGLSSKRSRRPMHLTRQRQLPAASIEGLEGRVLFAFNAYIAGVASGVKDVSSSFIFSTTGQPAKQFVIAWGDGSPNTTLTAPNPTVGFTTPQTVPHTYHVTGPQPLSAVATSTTNVTVSAVLGENSAFGNSASTGKEVQGLSDAASVGTNIAAVVDENNNTYVLSIDGKRMAVTRFKSDGTIDSGTGGWTTSGTYVLPAFTTSTNQDTPKAMAIDKVRNLLSVRKRRYVRRRVRQQEGGRRRGTRHETAIARRPDLTAGIF